MYSSISNTTPVYALAEELSLFVPGDVAGYPDFGPSEVREYLSDWLAIYPQAQFTARVEPHRVVLAFHSRRERTYRMVLDFHEHRLAAYRTATDRDSLLWEERRPTAQSLVAAADAFLANLWRK